MTFDPKAEARQSCVVGTYDHLEKCREWIERASRFTAPRDAPANWRQKYLNEALVELEMARLSGQCRDSGVKGE